MIKDIIKVKVIGEVEEKHLNEKEFHELKQGEVYSAKLEYWMPRVPMAYYIKDKDGFEFEIGDCDVDGNINLNEEYELVTA